MEAYKLVCENGKLLKLICSVKCSIKGNWESRCRDECANVLTSEVLKMPN